MSEKPDTPTDTRTRILDAAGRILVRDGSDGFTIAAVAKEAGVSKGGLFYHFESKDQLITGLIQHYVSGFDQLIAQALIQHYVSGFDQLIAQASDEPGAATRAYLRSAAQPAPRPVLALLAAAISNPAALESLNQRYTTWQRRLNHDGIPPHVATLVRCAIDGLWLAETFDLAAPNPATRSRMLAELEKLID